MAHVMTFYPLGNADCCRIDLECGKSMLVDYAATRNHKDNADRRCDLPKLLKTDLQARGKSHYEVVTFTHLDKDHFGGATEFFCLEHAEKYQDAGRVKMQTMWVPAAFLTEVGPEDAEARVLQREARYRFQEKKGIRVFSRPERLRLWCADKGINLDERRHLITDAGTTAPEFTLERDGAEFFIHSPFAKRQDTNTVEDRNGDSLIFQVAFQSGATAARALMLNDAIHESLGDIVVITRAKGNDSRLEWDVVKLPHHCSYLSIGPVKGGDRTDPTPEVAWLYETQGQQGAVMVGTCKPIPSEGSEEDRDPQPPHREAANYYRKVARKLAGQFVVTMEYPRESSPEPLVIEIDGSGATLKKSGRSAAAIVLSQDAPRAG